MNKKIESIDFIRCLAFLEVFSCHVLWGSGALGVSIFFVMSGFLLTYNYVPNITEGTLWSNIAYAKNKVKDLYPLHLIMMIYSLSVVLIVDRSNGISLTAAKIVSHVSLIQSWVPNRDIYFSLNGVSWYLSTAIFTYFCFPFLIKKLQGLTKKRVIVALCSLVCIGVCLSIALTIGRIREAVIYYITYIFPLYRLMDFAIDYLYVENMIPEAIKYSLIMLPFSIALIWIFSMQRGVVSQFVSGTKVFSAIAGLSGYGFLIHHKVIATLEVLISEVTSEYPSKYLVAVVAMIITLLLAKLYKIFLSKKKGEKI